MNGSATVYSAHSIKTKNSSKILHISSIFRPTNTIKTTSVQRNLSRGRIADMVLFHPSLPSVRHLDRFSRFCRAHERDQQTDTQTDRATPSVARIAISNRAHLAIAAMRSET